jgi:YD repeat-containing protein
MCKARKITSIYQLTGLIILLIVVIEIKAQIPVLNNVVSPSPNAASLANHVQNSTNLYTGVPAITFPVHQINSKKLSWPIMLSYHSAGIKVNEVAGLVGLGWSLEGANAVVTRAMRGLPDELNYGYFQYASTVPDETASISLSLKVDIAEGYVDMIPDVFYYNTGTSGGKILFDNQLVPRSIPHNDTKITTTGQYLDAFTLVEPDGTIFQFADHETSSTFVLGPDPAAFKSTWYLTRIISADRTDTIKFNYTTFSYQYVTNEQAMLKYYYGVPSGATKSNYQIEHETNTSQTSISNAKLLSSIVFHGGKLEFLNSNRNDGGGKKLDAIVVYYHDPFTKAYVEEKRINFGYSYFGSGASSRLRLDYLREQAGAEYLPPYEFIYSSKTLPAPTSFAQDHWGYYNGANGNTGLIPARQDGDRVLSSNNREVNTEYVDGCILSKIITPLDGETEYIFEPNEYLDGSTNKVGPGLRIKKIIERDPFSNINAITNYEYKRPSDGLSSGKLIDNPQYDEGMAVSDKVGSNTYNYNCWFIYARPMGVGNFSDSPILYEYATTYRGDSLSVAGKTISKFSIYNPGYSGYPYLPEEDDSWSAGRLISQEHYKVVGSTETIVSKVLNTFSIHTVTSEIKGLKAAYNKILINVTPVSDDFDVQNFFSYSKYQYLSESKNYSYEENSGTITSEQILNYFYDNELDYTMPVRVRTQTSEANLTIEEEMRYPPDFSTGVFTKMNNLNMIALPVERRTFKLGSTDYLIDYSKTEFQDWGSNNIYPQYTFRPKIASPVVRATFESSPATYLQKSLNLLQYSEFGKPCETKVENGQSRTIIIDSYHQNVIASCSPAAHNQIAYTGFETPYRGQWVVNQGSSQQNGNVALSLTNPSASFEIHASQSINYNYSVTRTSGASPTLTFSKVGATPIVHTLSLTSGSGSASLTPGIWVASIDWGINVTAMSVTFSYQYTYWNPLNISSTAKTGLQSLSLQTGNSISKTGLPAGDYTVSYYQKNGTVSFSVSGSASVLSTETNTAETDGWSMIRKNVRIVNTTDGLQLTCTSCLLDELRLQPMGSFMSTQSFDRQGRLRTETDQNFRSQYYEYDVWGRLKIMRDNDRNIVQHYEYKFASN